MDFVRDHLGQHLDFPTRQFLIVRVQHEHPFSCISMRRRLSIDGVTRCLNDRTVIGLIAYTGLANNMSTRLREVKAMISLNRKLSMTLLFSHDDGSPMQVLALLNEYLFDQSSYQLYAVGDVRIYNKMLQARS